MTPAGTNPVRHAQVVVVAVDTQLALAILSCVQGIGVVVVVVVVVDVVVAEHENGLPESVPRCTHAPLTQEYRATTSAGTKPDLH